MDSRRNLYSVFGVADRIQTKPRSKRCIRSKQIGGEVMEIPDIEGRDLQPTVLETVEQRIGEIRKEMEQLSDEYQILQAQRRRLKYGEWGQ